MLEPLTRSLGQRRDLTPAEIAEAVRALASESVSPELKADFLTALASKGESVEEIAGFARELRELATAPPLAPALRSAEILDVCGTGGDRLETFNISTTVALVAAAAGVVVAKHGNRAVTSRTGSADVLEALGIRTDLTPEEVARWLEIHGFAFLFAPRFHPAFRHIAPARKLCAERGQRTIFNFLGPLLNPARPSCQIVGVPSPSLCEPLAHVLQSLGVRRGMVVSGRVLMPGPASRGSNSSAVGEVRHLDELSTLGESTIAEFYHDRGFHCSVLPTAGLPLQPASITDLRGGGTSDNAAITVDLLRGRDQGPRRDAVLLNAGAALFVAGRCRSILEGWDKAGEVIDSGLAWSKLESLRMASRPG